MIPAILVGLTFGLSVALPFGPVSLVCVQRSIMGGVRYGFVSGIGAASAQGIFATVALIGQDAVSFELERWAGPMRWLSAALLLGLGLRTLVRRKQPAGHAVRARMSTAYGSTLALGLSNPLTVLPYLALASGAAAGRATGELFSSWSVPGVMVGAAAWYAVLSIASAAVGPGMLRGLLRPLNWVAGSVLVGFGVRVALG